MSRFTLPSITLASCLLAACAGTPIAGVEPIDGVISGECHTGMVRGAVGLAPARSGLARGLEQGAHLGGLVQPPAGGDGGTQRRSRRGGDF